MNFFSNTCYFYEETLSKKFYSTLQIPADAPWNAPKADEWDTMTYKEFLRQNCWTQ